MTTTTSHCRNTLRRNCVNTWSAACCNTVLPRQFVKLVAAPFAAPARELKQGPEPRNQDVGPRHGAPWRIDWATLPKRVHDADALACSCGGRLKFVELVTESTIAREVLASMGLPTAPPPIARARSPDFYQESFAADLGWQDDGVCNA